MQLSRFLIVTLMALALSGCGYFDRFRHVGEAPKLSAIANPVTQPGYRPVSMPMPAQAPPLFNSNSLWRSGARAFFKDQRAARVGDILTVIVEITDKAEIDNETKRSRDNAENAGILGFSGIEKHLEKILPNGTSVAELIKLKSKSNSDGSGSIEREEEIETKIAAVVTQVLPNGNMVIEGRQEMRVNFEMRELMVAGVVRPEDITSENTIPIAKIAEARVSYGGKGHITDVQQARYGQQVLDILLPF